MPVVRGARDIAIVALLALSLALNVIGHHENGSTLARLRHDEAATKSKAAYTRRVQEAGEPVAVCLLDAMKAVSPLLLRVPTVEAPLSAYVRLQSHRYTGVVCPERRK